MTKIEGKSGTSYAEFGNKSAPTLLCVHGLGLNKDMWQWQVPALQERYHVVTYDLNWHGKSAERSGEKPSLSGFVSQAINLLDHLGVERATWIGFSLGGMIVRRAAMDHPERVQRLAILNSAHRRSEEAQAAIEKRVVQARHEGPSSTVGAALERWFSQDYQAAHPEMMSLVREWVTSNNPAWYHHVYEVLASGVDELVAPNPPIECPTLVLTAEEDFGNSPDMSRAIASEIQGSELVILPRLRHMALAEDSEAVNSALMGFLSKSDHVLGETGGAQI